MRLARVGFQKEQKHLKCSMIFMWITFDEFGLRRIHQCLVFIKSCICFSAFLTLPIILRHIGKLSNHTMYRPRHSV
jgi:hypothetical protein